MIQFNLKKKKKKCKPVALEQKSITFSDVKISNGGARPTHLLKSHDLLWKHGRALCVAFDALLLYYYTILLLFIQNHKEASASVLPTVLPHFSVLWQ